MPSATVDPPCTAQDHVGNLLAGQWVIQRQGHDGQFCRRQEQCQLPAHTLDWLSLDDSGRLGDPGEIAASAAYLASDEAAFLTGYDLLIDGGYTAR